MPWHKALEIAQHNSTVGRDGGSEKGRTATSKGEAYASGLVSRDTQPPLADEGALHRENGGPGGSDGRGRSHSCFQDVLPTDAA
eukprot:1911976-Pyramimonas_sp.AAC.1